MIKKLFFTAALLVPGLAYGGNPSATLSVQVVPSSKVGTCGVITGQAATDVAAAGFNTCALYNDFTTAIPNTVGTGLPSNWLDCTYGGPSGAVWYFGVFSWVGKDPSTCNQVSQTTDPTTSALALDIQLRYNTLIQGNTASGYMMIRTTSFSNIDEPSTGLTPFLYQEITYRFDPAPTFDTGAFWGGAITANPADNTSTERDSWECGGFIGQQCNTEGSLFNMNSYSGFWDSSDVAFSTSDPTQYHTWGVLWTGDGNGNYSACTYVDGVKNGCHLDNQPSGANASALTVRHSLQIEHGMYSGGACSTDGDWTCLPNFGTRHLYIKDVKVLSCPSWTSTSAMCNGSALDSGGNFYR